MGEWPEQSEKPSRSADPENRNETQSALPAEIAFLQSKSISRDALYEVALIAREKNVPPSEILISRGLISRRDYLACLAEKTLTPLLPAKPPKGKVVIPQSGSPSAPYKTGLFSFPSALHLLTGNSLRLVVDPQSNGVSNFLWTIKGNSRSTRRPWIAPGSQLRRLWFEGARSRMAVQAKAYLARNYPEYSASRRVTIWQAAVLIVVLLLFASILTFSPGAGMLAFTALLSVFYFAIITLRVILINYLDEIPTDENFEIFHDAIDPEDYPLYSIMVALYREADGVDELVSALADLEWPEQKREIFLICEEDDHETIAAIRKLTLPSGFQLIICPYSQPRTKPKALNFVLPLCAGEFTVIYDAEDRPDRKQLLEAWTRFCRSGKDIACLQAPLLIHNGRQNWLTAMFALEYETLFLGILPILSRLGAPLPLGGTSNHFRTTALKSAGGWDPHNVTEDADLGIRLSRMGFRCGTIRRPTWEEAPPILSVWIKQRTRWLKGWLQTILVHTRNPVRTGRELGWKANLFFHLVLTSIVLSALFHPIFLVQVAYQFSQFQQVRQPDVYHLVVLGLSMFNLAGGYTTYGFLAYGVMTRQNYSSSRPYLLLFLPIYWLLISYVGWRAVRQMITNPFHWEKTAHGLANHHANANMK
ncbi:MAG: glycosyltransferase [Pseudomonadota bacterium]